MHVCCCGMNLALTNLIASKTDVLPPQQFAIDNICSLSTTLPLPIPTRLASYSLKLYFPARGCHYWAVKSTVTVVVGVRALDVTDTCVQLDSLCIKGEEPARRCHVLPQGPISTAFRAWSLPRTASSFDFDNKSRTEPTCHLKPSSGQHLHLVDVLGRGERTPWAKSTNGGPQLHL